MKYPRCSQAERCGKRMSHTKASTNFSEEERVTHREWKKEEEKKEKEKEGKKEA